jgi:hypothetical protein
VGFWRNVLPPFIHFYPEDGSSMFVQSVNSHLPDYAVSHTSEDCSLNAENEKAGQMLCLKDDGI